jgi:hypothetical protein
LAPGKKNIIPQHFTPILERLGIHRGMWMELVTKFDKRFGRVVGQAQQVIDSAAKASRRWYHRRQACTDAFG